MNILFLIGHLNTGGQERKLAMLAAALAERGHQVDVLVTFPGGRFDQDVRASKARLITIFDRYSEPNRRWLRLPGRHRLAIWWAIWRQLRRHGYDVVYGMGYRPNLYASTTSLFLPTKAVWGIEGVVSTAGPIGRVLERVFVRRTDLVIAVSDETRRYCLGRGFPPERTITIENGVDTERFRIEPEWRADVRHELGVADDEPLIGTFGRLHPVKNLEGFLHAAETVLRTNEAARFLILGPGEVGYRQRLQQLATELGIADRVVWVGARNDVERYYNALDVYVSASSSEGFGLARIEAMACGLPCVVTDVGNAVRIIGEAGQVVPVGDMDSLAAAVQKVIEAKSCCREEIRSSVVGRFSAMRQVDRTEGILRKLVDGGHRFDADT